MYVQPLMTYCSEVLITSSTNYLNKLEKVHNQALRLITGGIKTTPIDALLFVAKNSIFQSLMEERALILYEKLIRLPNDRYWSKYENLTRNLKTQKGYIQKVLELKGKIGIQTKPTCLPTLPNPITITPINHSLHLIYNIHKKGIKP